MLAGVSHLGAAALGIALGYAVAPTGTTQTASPVMIASADISDLIARLRPLVYKPDGGWYDNGVEIRVSGAGYTRIRLRMKNDDVYTSEAGTLRDAVTRITEPSIAINTALQGWKSQP